MKRRLQYAVILAVALAAGTVAAAAQETRVYREGNAWVEETTGALPVAARLRVSADMGSVQVAGAAQPNITYVVRKRIPRVSEEQARQQFGGYRVRALRQGNEVVVKGECVVRATCQRGLSVEFVVQGPRELTVNVETRAGNLKVDGIGGAVAAATAGGSVDLGALGGRVQAHTMGGNISLKSAAGDAALNTAGGSIAIGSVQGKITARTHGGSVKLHSSGGDAELVTAGGSIAVKQVGGRLSAATAGGSLDIGEVAGEVRLSTAGGTIRLHSAGGPVTATTAGGAIQLSNLSHGARAETASGGIRVQFTDGGTFTESSLLTTAGDVVVHLPPNLGVTVRAAIQMASGHQIRSDFPELRITSDESGFGPREVYGEGGINGGGPVLRIRTVAGNIDLRRGK